MTGNVIRVYNRRLEEVLFYLGVTSMGSEQTDEGMTIWFYPDTDKVKQIVKWFNESTVRRQNLRW